MRSLYLTTRDHLNHSNKISWILYIRLLVLNWLTYSIWWLPEVSWLGTSRWQCFHTTLFYTLNFSLFSFCLEFPVNFGPSFFFSVKSRDYNDYINDSTNYRRKISQQSNTKKVGTLPTFLLFFTFSPDSSPSQQCFLSQLTHQHWEGEKTVKCPNNFDWDCSYMQIIVSVVYIVSAICRS